MGVKKQCEVADDDGWRCQRRGTKYTKYNDDDEAVEHMWLCRKHAAELNNRR